MITKEDVLIKHTDTDPLTRFAFEMFNKNKIDKCENNVSRV